MHIHPSITRKRSMRCNELAYELPAVRAPHQDGGIPLSAFPNGKTSKLVGLFSTVYTVPSMLSVKQGSCEYQF